MAVPITAGSGVGLIVQAIGVAIGLAGLFLFAASLRRFVVNGRGTLAPWDPPERLVVRGALPATVRNPMISGVILVLVGEADPAIRISRMVGSDLFGVNSIYIPLLEEPLLRAPRASAGPTRRMHSPRTLADPWSPAFDPAVGDGSGWGRSRDNG